MKVKFEPLTPPPSPAMAADARARKQERHERQARTQATRREQMLNVAQTVIDAQGLDGLNMRLIARKAGYTAGALYAYFDSKEDIMRALQRRVLGRLADAVRNVKPPRAARVARSGVAGLAAAGGSKSTVAGPSQLLYLAQSLAWWRCLAQDPGGFQLLLLRPSLVSTSGSRHGGDSLSGPSAALGDLEAALQPCRDSLLACGLQESEAYGLHRELVACGLGLLALAAASGHSQPDGLESQWRNTLERWLALSTGPSQALQQVAAPQADGREQAVLFTG